MNKKYNELIKNTGIFTISSFSSRLLSFFLVPLYTSILSPNDYGIFDLANVSIALLIPILSLNIVDAVMRFLLDKSVNKGNVIAIGTRYVSIGISIGTLFIVANCALNFLPALKPFSVEILFVYVLMNIRQFLEQVSKGIGKVKLMGVLGVIGSFATIFFNILFLVILKLGVRGLFLSYIIGILIPSVIFIIFIKPWNYFSTIDGTTQKKIATEMLRYSIPGIGISVAWWINGAFDRWAVALLFDVSAAGLLSVAYKIPSILNTIQNICMQAWQISAAKEYTEENATSYYRRTYSYYMALFCISCSGLIFLNIPLCKILFSNSFFQAYRLVPFLLISSVFNCASGFIGAILAAIKDTKHILYATIVGAIINICLDFLLSSFIGVIGITIATAISSLIIFIVRNLFLKKMLTADKSLIPVYITWALLVIQALLVIYVKSCLFSGVISILIVILYAKQIKQFITLINKNK